jgi:hypothetical protein
MFITETQAENLREKIYASLINNPEYGLGEMGACREEAERIVNEWQTECSPERTGKTYTLELSFSEFHAIMEAMADYSNNRYNRRGTNPAAFNQAHAEMAEKLHDNLLDIYAK